jgi:drug/metabolite transporter (DMT)-like permease
VQRRASAQRPDALAAAAPAVFVVLWSTGFVAARAVTPHADSLALLAVRFGIAAALMALLAVALRVRWPRGATIGHVAVVGVLLHGVYLGGVFVAIARGMPAGLSALIVGLQPLISAGIVGPLLGERVAAAQWIGLVVGVVGVTLVLVSQLTVSGVTSFAVAASVAALFGITIGTLYQKRYCVGVDVAAGGVVQYAAAFGVMLVGVAATHQTRIEWTATTIAAFAWLVLVLSVGAVSLLMVLIRRGSAARTASLFYLVPALAAIEAWVLFDEALTIIAIFGIALTACGVWLVQRDPDRV